MSSHRRGKTLTCPVVSLSAVTTDQEEMWEEETNTTSLNPVQNAKGTSALVMISMMVGRSSCSGGSKEFCNGTLRYPLPLMTVHELTISCAFVNPADPALPRTSTTQRRALIRSGSSSSNDDSCVERQVTQSTGPDVVRRQQAFWPSALTPCLAVSVSTARSDT